MAGTEKGSAGGTRRVAVMQPYLFPYFPYIQLLACVDVFIIFDTAHFIARGWANRNVIELEKRRPGFVVPISKAARGTPFSDICFAQNVDHDLIQLRSTLRHAQRTAPFPEAPRQLLDATFPKPVSAGTSFVEAFERMSIALMQRLSFQTELVRASAIEPRGDAVAEDYIIRLVREVGGSEYVNPIGGTALYQQAHFAARDLRLSFLVPGAVADQPARDPGGLDLSILHALAYHSSADLHRRLKNFALVAGL